ncbi:alpha-amylase [Lutibacter agarilyticus]|uniref:Alpha-amylase n=1 Tax=Lutibacter agarilyticus TaxID=1109740 RepID=A0A238X2T0_9FLAO|nr:alpha-amylase family glycosyl hydrolase [Lutibacter agarilyticus]SNR53266.1 alpha-amylase [Lutibacter agarilyticus]
MRIFTSILLLTIVFSSCAPKKQENVELKPAAPFVWEGANIYFLLTDRFNNGNTANDLNYNRTNETGVLRGFEGGDIAGITQKIEENYFTDLGINAIWFTPVVEQVHESVDEGTGVTYAYHGYWAKDWTALDPNFGTKEDLKKMVEAAHAKGIRVVMDGVINHTGPVTAQDPVWPSNWVRTSPLCKYQDYDSTVNCTLVENLPDVLTASTENVELPTHLVEKWKAEGRYEQEVKELDEFFARTGYPRAPKFYIIKWLTDYIREFGVDGYRADTVKHTDELVWQEFKTECDVAFAEWKANNPELVLDDTNFYTVAEVYNYGISGGRYFDFGDKKVDYFDKAFQSSINFEFKWNVAQTDTYEALFSRYSSILNNELKGYGVLNYLTSHDDGQPFDKDRTKTFEAATKLLLSPGASQVYYGDESARNLIVEGAVGDATLRTFMNWDAIANNSETKMLLTHYQKLGQFRVNHPSVGAGVHKMITESPYVFQRTFSKGDYSDAVIVALDLKEIKKEISVGTIFKDNEVVYDAYSDSELIVKNGKVVFSSPYPIVLLEKK